MKTNRCILIDVQNESVTEVFLEDGLDAIYEALKCSTFEAVNIRDNNDIFVDEEGLFKVNENTKFFQYGSSQPLVGNGLVTSYGDEGETIDTTMSVDEVRKEVKFLTLNDLRRKGFL